MFGGCVSVVEAADDKVTEQTQLQQCEAVKWTVKK